jgi:hypothetical protein
LINNIAFTIILNFWLFYSIGISLINQVGIVDDDDRGSNNVGMEEEATAVL